MEGGLLAIAGRGWSLCTGAGARKYLILLLAGAGDEITS